MKILEKLLSTNHKTKARFILVGIWNTIFGYFVFVFFDTLFSYILPTRYLAYMFAMTLGQIIAIINAFIFHKYYTFRSKVEGNAVIMEFFRFALTYAFTFLLSLVLLPVFVEVMKLNPKVAGATMIPVITVISYLGHSKYSFRIRQK